VTHETKHLEVALTASQTALAVVEGENSAALAQLVGPDARVAGEIFKRNPISLSFCSIVLLLTPVLLTAALTEQLEALQLEANNAVGILNARGSLLSNCLKDIPMHIGEIALHGVHHGAAVT
jgi:hypothetical protein